MKTNYQVLSNYLGRRLLNDGAMTDTKYWQAQNIEDGQGMGVHPIELIGVSVVFDIPETWQAARDLVQPNMPWAEKHFQERVSGIAYNPPPSHVDWPHAQEDNDEHLLGGKFSHTYPERFWPKWVADDDRFVMSGMPRPNEGIRFEYGDLNDVIQLLVRDPSTRQAYLPIFFPEDTGAAQGQRIPCTLGYQFLLRNEQVHIIYGIRSCDFLRHFPDDVYMAMRLAQWVRDRLLLEEKMTYTMGELHMNIGSLHIFEGDLGIMRMRYK